MKLKKAELSLNIVIAAALAMIVLVILSVLIFNAGSDITRGTECENLGAHAVCVPVYQGEERQTCVIEGERAGERWSTHPTANCRNEYEVCCIRPQ